MRALERAAEKMGGRDKLARHLEVRETHLKYWMSGKCQTPPGVFLQVVDYLMVVDRER